MLPTLFIITAREDNATQLKPILDATLARGARWIHVRPSAAASASLENALAEMGKACRAAGAIFSVENDAALAKHLAADGILVADGLEAALAARQTLGDEALVGLFVSEPEEALALPKAVIDFVAFRPAEAGDNGAAAKAAGAKQLAAIRHAMTTAGCDMPLVAFGNIAPEEHNVWEKAGASGVAVDA